MSDQDTPQPEATQPEIQVACLVKKPTSYGLADLGTGARIRLPKSEALALQDLGFLEITGV